MTADNIPLDDIPQIISLEYVKGQKEIDDDLQDIILLGLIHEVNSTIYTDVILKTDESKIAGTNFFVILKTPAMLLFEANYALKENNDKDMHDAYIKRYEKSISKVLNSMRKFDRISGWS